MRRRKCQFISNIPNLLKNCIWARYLWSEHLIPSVFQGGFLVRLQTKKNHITNLKSALRTLLINLLFHVGFCQVKIVLQEVKNLMSVSKNHVNCLNWWTAEGGWEEYWRCMTIDCFIWSHFRCNMVGIIVPPFSEREPLCPLMFFFRDEITKISFSIFFDDCSRTLY